MPIVKVVLDSAEASIVFESPNTLVGEILDRALTSLNVAEPRSAFGVKYRGKALDQLLPFRLAGVLSNSTLEVVRIAPQKAPSGTTGENDQAAVSGLVQIAVDLGAGRKRVEGRFAPDTLLSNVISSLCGQLDEVSAARYLNRRIEKDQFATATLQSLGLTQGAALIRLEGATNVPTERPPGSADTSDNGLTTSPSRPISLISDIPSLEDRQIAVVTLMRLVRNVIVSPDEEKVKLIRLNNPVIKAKLRDSPTCTQLLLDAGFERQDSNGEPLLVVTKVDDKRLRKVFVELNSLADELEIPYNQRPSLQLEGSTTKPAPAPAAEIPFEFDPFRTNVIGLSQPPGPTIRVEESGIPTLAQQVEELKKKKDATMQADAKVVDRRLIALLPSSDFNPRRFVAAEEEEDGSMEVARSEPVDAAAMNALSEHYKSMQERQKKAENFQTRAMREYDQLSKMKVYTRTLIRVQLPNRTIVQALFSPLETIGDVCSVLKDACPTLNTTEFSLMISPPPQKLDPKASLESLGFVPAAIIQLSCPQGSVIDVKPDLIVDNVASINVPVPKGVPLVRTASSVKTSAKPKWLKL